MANMTVTDYLLRKVLSHDDQLEELRIRVGAIKDYADQINAYTSQQAEDIANIADQVATVVTKLDEVDSELAAELAPAVDSLRVATERLDAVANPTVPENPIPTPGEPTEPGTPGEPV